LSLAKLQLSDSRLVPEFLSRPTNLGIFYGLLLSLLISASYSHSSHPQIGLV
jgi:hypothetical protein